MISLFDSSFEFITFSFLASAVPFLLSTIVVTSPSVFISSSASSPFTEQGDLQSRVREAEAFIQANLPGNALKPLSKTQLFPFNLGGGGMVLPVMRTASTIATVGVDVRSAANPGKSVDEQDGFGDLIASNFSSRVAGGEIITSMDERDSLIHDDNEYSHNSDSLGGGTLVGSIGLAGRDH